MQILLKKMSLVNFKGIRSAELDFNPTVNTVLGDNATGKTTIMNAFLWCLFGKDIEDRKDYEIKTYDKDGVIIPQIDHSVELFIDVDFREITLKRVLSEKWQKKRGSDDLEFTGNETTYFWNEVPLKQSEYQSKIKDLIDEGLFKLLTNVNYFHTLHWEKRREIIFSLAGEITDSEILSESDMETDHSQIIGNILSHGKTMAEAKAETANKKKRIKDEIQFIPARIDEAERSKPEPDDVKAINAEKSALQKQIDSKQDELNQIIKAETDYNTRLNMINKDYNERLDLFYKVKTEASMLQKKIELDVRSQYEDVNLKKESLLKEISELQTRIGKLTERIAAGVEKIAAIEIKLNEKRKEWTAINSETLTEFDEQTCKCPTCKQSLPDDDVRLRKDEFVKNFNSHKQDRLNQNKNTGLELVGQKNDLESLKNDLIDERTKCTAKLDNLTIEMNGLSIIDPETIQGKVNEALSDNTELIDLIAKQIELEGLLTNKAEKDETGNELFVQRQGLQTEINIFNKQLIELSSRAGNDEQIKIIDKRIAELKEQESTLAQELNRLEKIEFAILQFEKQRVNYIEE